MESSEIIKQNKTNLTVILFYCLFLYCKCVLMLILSLLFLNLIIVYYSFKILSVTRNVLVLL